MPLSCSSKVARLSMSFCRSISPDEITPFCAARITLVPGFPSQVAQGVGNRPQVTHFAIGLNGLLVVFCSGLAVTLTVTIVCYSMQRLGDPPGVLSLVAEFQTLLKVGHCFFTGILSCPHPYGNNSTPSGIPEFLVNSKTFFPEQKFFLSFIYET